MFREFNWGDVLSIARSALTTIEICAIAIVIGSIIGVVLGVASASRLRAWRIIAGIYINAVRGIPLLVVIFFIYFGLPLMFGSGGMPAFASAAAALSVYTAAYMGEVVRGGIRAVPKAQHEAASALGFGYFERIRLIILPQAVPVIIPPGIGFCIALVKDSSLVSVVGLLELTGAGRVIGSVTTTPILTFLVVALFYFVISYALSKLSRWYERRAALRYGAHA